MSARKSRLMESYRTMSRCTCGLPDSPNELPPRDPWCPVHGTDLTLPNSHPDALREEMRASAERLTIAKEAIMQSTTEQVEVVAVVTAALKMPHTTLELLVGRPYDGSGGWREEAQIKAAEYAEGCASFMTEGEKDYEVGVQVETFEDILVGDACICTPEQRASGGFKSSCPVHGV